MNQMDRATKKNTGFTAEERAEGARVRERIRLFYEALAASKEIPT